MSKVNFFCVGAQKSGTTTLHNILSQHPDFCLPQKKETHFFSNEKIYNRGKTYYLSYFDRSKSYKYFGEVDPEYSYFTESAERIFNTFGKVKILFILRDPVDRAYSHYLMTKRRGIENFSFEKAMAEEKDRINNNDGKMHYSYCSRGYYLDQLLNYEHYFGKDNIKILLFEEFIKNPLGSITEIASFIGLNEFEFTNTNKNNPASHPRFEYLQKLLYKESKFKKVIGNLIKSKETKRFIAEYIERVNLKTTIKEDIPETIKKKIYDTYYKKQILDLEKKINLNLDNWKH